MGSSRVLRAFLFTDIVDATALKQRLGDARGAGAIEAHDKIFRELLRAHGGQEHENPGDGFFASFELPSDALQMALAFQQRLHGLQLAEPLQIRAGVHMGETVRVEQGDRDGKLLGLAIDTTARVMGLALPGQVLLTRHAFDSVRQQVVEGENGAPITWLAHGQYLFKGVRDPLEVFEAGIENISPLCPPAESDKAQRMLAPGDEETLGWRPAVGLPVPGRDSWELERKLGEGSFGEVWLAKHAETKYVRTFKFCYQADRLRSLKRELKLFRLMAEALGDRKDIARLYEVSLREPPYFLEMEYTPGGNLAEWAAKQGGIDKVPLDQRLELIAQIGGALAAAHSIGVIHKDVKPANVLIHEERDGRLQARLTDFGIGELLDKQKLVDMNMSVSVFAEPLMDADTYGTMTGTRMYVAPEFMAGQPASVRTDVFALGVLLFQMVVGDLRRPIAHGWERDVEDELLREDIADCVAGNPDDRIASPLVLVDRLRTLDRRRERRAAEQRVSEQNRRRRRLLMVSSAFLVLFAAVAAAFGAAYWRSNEQVRQERVAREKAEQDLVQAIEARDGAIAARARLERLGRERVAETQQRDALLRDLQREVDGLRAGAEQADAQAEAVRRHLQREERVVAGWREVLTAALAADSASALALLDRFAATLEAQPPTELLGNVDGYLLLADLYLVAGETSRAREQAIVAKTQMDKAGRDAMLAARDDVLRLAEIFDRLGDALRATELRERVE